MQATTKRRARQVQQALLALPDTLLLETIDQWLKVLDEYFLEDSKTDVYYEVLAYRILRRQTKGE